MTTKFDIVKFFWEERLWVVKTQDGSHLNSTRLCWCFEGWNENMPASMSQKEKIDMINRAKSVIILYLGDKALREVTKEKTVEKTVASSMWGSLSHCIWPSHWHIDFVRNIIVFVQNDRLKNMVEQLVDFNKILDELNNMEMKLENEDKVLLLITQDVRTF